MGISGGILANANAKSTSISAVVIRANGRRENLGVIAYHHRNPLMRWAVNAWILVKERFR